MNFNADGLFIQLAPARAIDDEDWCRVHVIARVPGISADFEAYLQGADLQKFAREMSEMHASVGKPCTANLSSYEHGIRIDLAMQSLGGISGSYELRPEGDIETLGKLNGVFRMDQSYLPEVVSSVERLLEELRAHAA